jgi:hypothetical protein
VPCEGHRSSPVIRVPLFQRSLALQSAIWMDNYRCASAFLASSRFLLLCSRL